MSQEGIVFSIIVPLIIWCICAGMAISLKLEKNYEAGIGTFLLGILLGIFYLIYCAGLPMCVESASNSEEEEEEKDLFDESIEYCKNCGFPLDEKGECSNCGEKKKSNNKTNNKKRG